MLKTATKQYKFVLVGDSAVGKSSLINRFVDKTFNQSLMSTIGVDFKFKKVRIDNNDVKLQIWDTAGQQAFRSIISAYYSSADAIVIVYDITSYESFQNVKEYWIKQVDNNNKNNAKVYLIGNKIDEDSRRQVEKFTIQTFMEENYISGLFEASAKNGQKVEQAFTQIAKNLYFGLGNENQNIKKNNKQNNPKPSARSQNLKKSVNLDEKKKKQQRISQNDGDQQEQTGKQSIRKQNHIKIGQQNGRPKNPNYNKSCCSK